MPVSDFRLTKQLEGADTPSSRLLALAPRFSFQGNVFRGWALKDRIYSEFF